MNERMNEYKARTQIFIIEKKKKKEVNERCHANASLVINYKIDIHFFEVKRRQFITELYSYT